MKLDELMGRTGDAITVRRVYAEPYEKDEVTIIPGAVVSGGGGGGTGHDERGQEGSGGGFGVNARPAGAFVLRKGRLRWRPAVDINRFLMMLGVVTVVYLVTRDRARKRRQ